ncbi:MAG: ABC transporter permease [Firmicutes bacterium]|nr:ABC transporter permease [Bacillota bacterium]
MKNILDLAYNIIGLPRLIISIFLLVFLIAAAVVDLSIPMLTGSLLVRVGMNAVLVLALIPAIKAGTGLNLALPLGIMCGLVGAVVAIEYKLSGAASFAVALAIAVPLAIIVGYLYGLVLNRIKGQEMIVGTYVGFSVVSGMCIFWLLAPFKNPEMVWAYGGTGLRNTILLHSSFDKILNDFLGFKIGEIEIPTGLLLFFGLLCFMVWLFGKTRTGNAMHVAGSNPRFALSCGINIDKMRILGTVLSTILACIGILVYSQSYGFLQLYQGPLMMAFPAAAAILIGGASPKKAAISHVIIGTFLFQSLLVVAPPVINVLVEGSFSEVFRGIVSNGVILYALATKWEGGE